MTAPVREGDVLAGKYRVDSVLGSGGMGVVVAATHLELDQRVALKFLLPNALTDPQAVARFKREARASVKLKSEHVARVIDVGSLESGSPFIVMELLAGHDLGALLERQGRLDPRFAVDLVLQACEAIQEAHLAGVVHRDLKPANLFITTGVDGEPFVKVLDFGISKTLTPGSGSDVGLTSSSAFMGSPLYMSPEQIQSAKDADGRADIWSLGVILFELLAGRPPFNEDNFASLLVAILQNEPPALPSLAPGTPPSLTATVTRCLRKSRDERFANIGELAGALAPHGTDRAQASVRRIYGMLAATGRHVDSLLAPRISHEPPPATAPAQSGVETVPATSSTWGKSADDRKRSGARRIWVAIPAVVAASAFGIGAAWMLGRSSRQAEAAGSPAAPTTNPAAVPAAELTVPVPAAPSAAIALPSITASRMADAGPSVPKPEPAIPKVPAAPLPGVKSPKPPRAADAPPKPPPAPKPKDLFADPQ